MKAKSLSVFRTKLRHTDEGTILVSIGDVIEGDDEHITALARNRLVELVDGDTEKSVKAATPKGEPKPASAAKPAKPKGVQVKGKAVAAPLAGKSKGVQMPPVDGDAILPPVQSSPAGTSETPGAPKGEEGKE